MGGGNGRHAGLKIQFLYGVWVRFPFRVQTKLFIKNMKIKVIVIIIIISFFFQGCRSTYKKRKGCRGKGAWYGKRNLSLNNEIPTNYIELKKL